MTRVGFIAAWLIATGLATAFAWQVVGAANSQVSDAPLTPLIAITAVTPSDTASQVSTTTSSVVDPHTSNTTTTSHGNTTTTSATESTTTTVAPKVGATTAVSRGGTVSVRGSEPGVELVAVVANPGWSYEVATDDGTRVEVRFEHQLGEQIRIRCEWTDGLLVAAIDN